MDDTLRISLPREVRLALRSQKTLFYNGGLDSQRLLLNPAYPGGALSTGVVDLAHSTLGRLGPYSYGTPKSGLRRDCGHPAPRPCNLAPHTVAPHSDRPSRRTPPTTVADSFSHLGGRHRLMDLHGQRALHTAQHHALILPGSVCQRDTTTLCGRGGRGNHPALLVPRTGCNMSHSVPQRTPHRLEPLQGLRPTHVS